MNTHACTWVHALARARPCANSVAIRLGRVNEENILPWVHNPRRLNPYPGYWKPTMRFLSDTTLQLENHRVVVPSLWALDASH